MAMGGGGGAAPPAGLQPMQRANYDIAREMVYGGGGTKGSIYDARRYGMEMQRLARGGLMNWGMQQVQQGLKAPAMGPAMMTRQAARYGAALTPEQTQAAQQAAALGQASTSVAVQNQARRGLQGAMQDMRFKGIQI